jgi:hypothetical protein
MNQSDTTIDQGILLLGGKNIYIFLVDCETHDAVY